MRMLELVGFVCLVATFAVGSACGPESAPGLSDGAAGAAGALGPDAAGLAAAGGEDAREAGGDGGAPLPHGGASAGRDGTSGGEPPGGEGTAGGSAPGGEGAGGGVSACGNGRIDGEEECDGEDLGGATCESLGFTAGALGCVDCRLERSGCAWTEDCYDGFDNDEDGDADCGDTDCAERCADPCADPPEVPDAGWVIGDTTGRPDLIRASCGERPDLSGPESTYRYVAATDGVLDVRLASSAADLRLSIWNGCGTGAVEIVCADDGTASTPVGADDELFLVVDGVEPGAFGPFYLEVSTRPVVCGDALLDGAEECDDGGIEPGDGCDAGCLVESSEGEENDTATTADPLSTPYFGRIAPGNDVDWIAVEITEEGSTLVAATRGFVASACADGQLDTVVELYDASGAELLARNDDAGSRCSRVEASGLAAGAYLLRVQGGADDAPAFSYARDVTLE